MHRETEKGTTPVCKAPGVKLFEYVCDSSGRRPQKASQRSMLQRSMLGT